MADQPYTLAGWRVAPGNEDAFVAVQQELAAVFLSLKPPPRWGTLIRSVDDPDLFYSFASSPHSLQSYRPLPTGTIPPRPEGSTT